MPLFNSSRERTSKDQERDSANMGSTHDEPPPPEYSLHGGADAARPQLSAADVSNNGDPFAFLSHFDTIFLIDDSSSMAGASWREVQTVLSQIVPICAKHDEDGVDVEFLNNELTFHNVKDPQAINDAFRRVFPVGLTPTGQRVFNILDPYVTRVEKATNAGTPLPKPVNLIVITDGVPNDGDRYDLASVLERLALRLDAVRAPNHQVGVQFFQVGCEPQAAEALRALDDDLGGRVLSGKLRDIVDTSTFDSNDGRESVLTSEAVLKVVLGAVVRRLDDCVMGKSKQR